LYPLNPMNDTYLTAQLSQCLQEILSIAQDGKIESLCGFLRNTIENIGSPLQLAVIGNISSSKSTFVNALLGAEIVGMGMMETTYNVSWIKYGSIDNDIKVAYKDGHTDLIARGEWGKWSNQSAEKLKNEVLYLEVTYPNETLKRINIIDTPGLNSVKGTDSQNTIDFLQRVKPDAVIMTFTKAIAESTMEVLTGFQNVRGDKAFHLSPLNAIGLYAKIDSIWMSNQDVTPLERAKEVISDNVFANFPQLKKSLHTIFPICSILGLAAKTITKEEYRLFEKLTFLPSGMMKKLCADPDNFIDTDISQYTDVTIEEREKLYERYQLYGIYSIVSYLSEKDRDIQQVKDYLLTISGMRTVENRLLMHFGDRAMLIKTQNIAEYILHECKRIRQIPDVSTYADRIEQKLLLTLRTINEYKELKYLSRIYDGELSNVQQDALEEYKTLCGEYGYSVLQRLQLPTGSDYQEIISAVKQKAERANMKANLYRVMSPQNAELYNMMCLSYNILIRRIEEMQQRKCNAEQELIIAKSFFEGD